MEFTTAKNYHAVLLLLLAGLALGILIMATQAGEPGFYAGLFISSWVLLAPLFFKEYLSIDIVDDHLVLKTIQIFSRKTILMNIKEIELELYYTPPGPKASGNYYSMRIIRNKIVIHKIKYDKDKINDFIQAFNKEKRQLLNRQVTHTRN